MAGRTRRGAGTGLFTSVNSAGPIKREAKADRVRSQPGACWSDTYPPSPDDEAGRKVHESAGGTAGRNGLRVGAESGSSRGTGNMNPQGVSG